MKKMWFLALLFTNGVFSQEYQASYRVTFVGEWSATSHPVDYPNNAHFSALIGHTHNAQGSIWGPGILASPGVENMAETGSTLRMSQEINALINDGHAELRLLGSQPGALSSVSIVFDITESHPLVSLTTMIAPSPDWFVGVHDLNLMRSGLWQEEVIVDLLPYDSGTDDGVTFTSPDADTDPADPISRITSSPFPNNVPLAAMVFTRLSTTGQPPDDIFLAGFDE